MTFAQGTLASSRTTQVFMNFGDNSRLDIDGFAPFGEVASSVILAERVFSDYGDAPDQGRILLEGNASNLAGEGPASENCPVRGVFTCDDRQSSRD